MTNEHSCPYCQAGLVEAFLYVRGIAGSLQIGESADVGLFSRAGLTQINLDDISTTDPGTQAVIPSLHCDNCGTLAFRTTKP